MTVLPEKACTSAFLVRDLNVGLYFYGGQKNRKWDVEMIKNAVADPSSRGPERTPNATVRTADRNPGGGGGFDRRLHVDAGLGNFWLNSG